MGTGEALPVVEEEVSPPERQTHTERQTERVNQQCNNVKDSKTKRERGSREMRGTE